MTAPRIALLLTLACAGLGAAPDPVGGLRDWLTRPAAERPDFGSVPFADAPLSKEQAARVRDMLWQDHVATVRATRRKEWDEQSITIDGMTLKWKHKQFGAKP